VTTEGFTVRVFYGDTGKIFTDGFEGGGTGDWSTTFLMTKFCQRGGWFQDLLIMLK
jgi:hypothetical protein